MKKTFILFISILMILVLSACPAPDSDPSGQEGGSGDKPVPKPEKGTELWLNLDWFGIDTENIDAVRYTEINVFSRSAEAPRIIKVESGKDSVLLGRYQKAAWLDFKAEALDKAGKVLKEKIGGLDIDPAIRKIDIRMPKVYIRNSDIHLEGGASYHVTALNPDTGKGPEPGADPEMDAFQLSVDYVPGSELTLVPGLGAFLDYWGEIEVETINTGEGGLPRMEPYFKNIITKNPEDSDYFIDGKNRIVEQSSVTIAVPAPASDPDFGTVIGYNVKSPAFGKDYFFSTVITDGKAVVGTFELYPGEYTFEALPMMRNSRDPGEYPMLEDPAGPIFKGKFTVPYGGGEVLIPLDSMKYYAQVTVMPEPDWKHDRIAIHFDCERENPEQGIDSGDSGIVLIDRCLSKDILIEAGTCTLRATGSRDKSTEKFEAVTGEMFLEAGKTYEWRPDLRQDKSKNSRWVSMVIHGDVDSLRYFSVRFREPGTGNVKTCEKKFQVMSTWGDGMTLLLWNVPVSMSEFSVMKWNNVGAGSWCEEATLPPEGYHLEYRSSGHKLEAVPDK